MTPQEFERFVGAILRDLLDCEVHHMGGPNDQGIDLLLIDGEKRILVQAKRRTKTGRSEQVSVIREVIGSLVVIMFSLSKNQRFASRSVPRSLTHLYV